MAKYPLKCLKSCLKTRVIGIRTSHKCVCTGTNKGIHLEEQCVVIFLTGYLSYDESNVAVALLLTVVRILVKGNLPPPFLVNITSGFRTDSCSSCVFSWITSFLERTTSSWYSSMVLSTSRKICSAAAASCSLTSCLSRCAPAIIGANSR